MLADRLPLISKTGLILKHYLACITEVTWYEQSLSLLQKIVRWQIWNFLGT